MPWSQASPANTRPTCHWSVSVNTLISLVSYAHRARDPRAGDQEGGPGRSHAPGYRHVREVGVGDVQRHRGQEVAWDEMKV